MNARTTLLGAALVAAIATPAAAQTCVGMPSFAAAPMRADFGLSFPSGGTGLSAGLAFSAARPPLRTIAAVGPDAGRLPIPG
ncbi:MAG: hypothetical protein ACYC3Q_12295 [Gemmatimonadaceae bacterium]